MKYIFGPVNSRRLGISLGVDLVLFKTCSLNCIYCECGETTILTEEPFDPVPAEEVISELDQFLSKKPALNAVTFSGSGEPLLHSRIGDIIDHLKDNYPYRVVVLTNGALLRDEKVRRRVLRADTIIPSLDAVSPDIFKKMLRPAPGIDPEDVIKGLEMFRGEYSGELIIEVFIVPGFNDSGDELTLIKDACRRIKPDLVQINTLDRPGTVKSIIPASSGTMNDIKRFFMPLPVEITGSAAVSPESTNEIDQDIDSRILSSVERRPATVEDLEVTLGLKRVEILKHITHLLNSGKLKEENGPRGIYYTVSR